ncbi:helix-turn-helix domain-containing protein [Pseudaestuariivita atlantica]|uniref:Transcriptional regulator n=1 Tax=Pseudaestuariivita atlantica TaxID=1317121 RepID=A0A0L1JKE0_9RHOB|nr:helix-turn-helix domain-containing protein [Pseudaestuariivita atlantica]KNG92187.1 hypothetical protein ATO11_18535 [Pseudaestuariivita atlantica]
MYISNQKEFEAPQATATLQIKCRGASVTMRVRKLKPAQNLFREGDDARHVYEVTSGVLRLIKVLEDGRRQVIAFGYPGDIVGFPQDGCHYTECDALSSTEVIAHSIRDLECGERNPELHQRLVNAALKEISAMQDRFMMLGRKSAVEKVASFIFALMERSGKPLGAYTHFEFPMVRADIADFLGMTTETVSRTVTSLRKQKMIALRNANSVVVLNEDALYDLANPA